MAEFGKYLQYSTAYGQSVERGNVVVTPISGALRLNLPFLNFVWNRPVAVMVEEGDSSKKLPIIDVTMLSQIFLFGIGLTAAMLTILVTRTNKTR